MSRTNQVPALLPVSCEVALVESDRKLGVMVSFGVALADGQGQTRFVLTKRQCNLLIDGLQEGVRALDAETLSN